MGLLTGTNQVKEEVNGGQVAALTNRNAYVSVPGYYSELLVIMHGDNETAGSF